MHVVGKSAVAEYVNEKVTADRVASRKHVHVLARYFVLVAFQMFQDFFSVHVISKSEKRVALIVTKNIFCILYILLLQFLLLESLRHCLFPIQPVHQLAFSEVFFFPVAEFKLSRIFLFGLAPFVFLFVLAKDLPRDCLFVADFNERL